MFLVFPSNVSENQIETIGLTIGRQVLSDREECYAQHPYVRGMFKGFKTEIVPCFQIHDALEKRSAVDRTPLHTQYIIDHLRYDQRAEVRFLKQFLKGIGCYGADAEIEGFSGYLCELIILYYSTFQNTIEAVAEWKLGVTLRLDNNDFPFFDTPLIFIDPVDSKRNVASAVVRKKFDLFVEASRAYFKYPALSFFFPKPLKLWSLEKIQNSLADRKILGVEFPHPRILLENLYPQLRKATRTINDTVTTYGFRILDTAFYLTETNVGVILFPELENISSTVIHMGPPIHLKKNSEEFIDKWRDHPRAVNAPYIHEGRWYVEIKREYTNLSTMLSDVIQTLSIGKHLSELSIKDCCVKHKTDLIITDLQVFWTEYLDKRMPWER
jgi:tRNA nucleotidyltransferase (CCA-adding enzyme)